MILKIIKANRPETVRELVYLVHAQAQVPEKQIFLIVQELEDDAKVRFERMTYPESTSNYIFSFKPFWFWICIFFSIFLIFFVYTPENLFPQVLYPRSVLGVLFVIFFPGYAFIKILYPIDISLKTLNTTSSLNLIERVTLSFGLSLAITAVLSTFFNYTSIGVNLSSILCSIVIVTIFFASLGVWREYTLRRSIFLGRVFMITNYEFKEKVLRFFDERGLIKKQRIIIKEIPIDQISTVSYRDGELSITVNGVTFIFLMKNADTLKSLQEKLNDLRNGEH
jgi:hypothetical protein